jgi:hypothetical protein
MAVLALAIARSGGDMLELRQQLADSKDAPRAAKIITRSPIGAADLGNSSWAGNIAPYAEINGGFLQSMDAFSAWDKVYAHTRRAPLRSRLAIAVYSLTAHTHQPGQAAPISSLGFNADTIDEQVALALIVLSDEMLMFAAPEGAEAAFLSELRRGLGVVTDAQFITGLEAAAAASHAASGDDATDVRADVTAALTEIDVSPTSALYLLVPAKMYLRLSLKTTTDGASAFPNFPKIGEVEVVPTSAIAEDSSGGATLLLIDADQILTGDDIVTFRASNQAAIEMSDAPGSNASTGTGASMVSMFQSNSTALLAQRTFGFKVGRTRAVTKITGASY